jgi:cytochrome b
MNDKEMQPMQLNELDNPIRNGKEVLVWDLPIRLFHWILVLGAIAAYFSAKFHHGVLHSAIGYGLIILVTVRIIWGAVGSRYARFRSFIFSLRETVDYLRSIATGEPRHYIGHNPAGALMVFALLTILSSLFLTGLLTLATIDFPPCQTTCRVTF